LKVIIIGAGEVGYDLGSMLSQEKHDVVILDRDKDALRLCGENDVLTIEGNATSAQDLQRAGVADADLVVAATNLDEVNMVAALLSKRLGAVKVIARIRNDEFSRPNALVRPADMGIDVMIHPEQSVAREIVLLVKRAAASDVVSLAEGKMQLVGIRLDRNSPLAGKKLSEVALLAPQTPFRVVAIYRGGFTLIPFGNDRLQANDHIFVLARTEDIGAVLGITGHENRKIRNIMITGGTTVGAMIARMLSQDETDWKVKLIEPDYETSYELATELRDVLVLHGNPTDPNLLVTEGITETDVFIAVTEDEESNIISCLMAKHLKVPKVIAMVSKPDYIPLSQTIGLDAAVNKKLAASNEIHRLVRKGSVLSVAALHGIKAEVLEFEATPTSKITGHTMAKLVFPKGCVVGGIIRAGVAEVATGNTVVETGDRVIVFCLPEAIDKITSYF
jgi:trk system potassium uptake protein TrkA